MFAKTPLFSLGKQSVKKSNVKSTIANATSAFKIPRSSNVSSFANTKFTTSLVSKRSFATETKNPNQLTLEVRRDGSGRKLYRLRVPLSKDSVVFSPNGQETVGNFLKDLKQEDSSVQNAAVHDLSGSRVSASSRLEEVFDSPFELVLNGKKYSVGVGASSTRSFAEDLESVNAAYEAMKNAGTPGTPVPSHLVPATVAEIAAIEKELLPLMRIKLELDRKAYRFADLSLFGGLGAFSAQWMFLARLTWWDFNWDIMEPVTYFITSGTALLAYVYFVLVKQEYTFENLRDGIATKRMLTNYVKSPEFDIDRYFDLEYELKVRDPEALLRLEAYCTGHSPIPKELEDLVAESKTA